MNTPLIVLSASFQSVFAGAPSIEAVFNGFCYNHVNEDHPVVYQDELSLMKHNDFQPLESKKLNKA